LEIRIEGGRCNGQTNGQTHRYTHSQLSRLLNEKFELGIVGAAADVGFYQVDEIFNRATNRHDQDFRWAIDVEGPDLYNDQVRNRRPHYKPKLMIKNGTFYTSEKTYSTFKWVNQRDPTIESYLGVIDYCIAARIKLNSGQEAKFEFKDPDGRHVECLFTPGGPPAKIYFTTLCRDQSGNVVKENDFHHHFGTFDPPAGKDVHDLKLVDRRSGAHACEGLPSDNMKMSSAEREKGAPVSTDDAPCKGMVYSQTPGTG
jgi:hypothetical protein